jgi:hypothetical protein
LERYPDRGLFVVKMLAELFSEQVLAGKAVAPVGS